MRRSRTAAPVPRIASGSPSGAARAWWPCGAARRAPGLRERARPRSGWSWRSGLVDARARPAPVNHEVSARPRPSRASSSSSTASTSSELALGHRLPARRSRRSRADLAARARPHRAAAAPHGARPVTVGILPTLRAEDLGPAAMSDSPRFRALGQRSARPARRALRDPDRGPGAARDAWDDVTLEGAATGLHVHLRVPPSALRGHVERGPGGHRPGAGRRDQLAAAPGAACCGRRPGSRCSGRPWTTARRSARPGCPRAPRSATAGSADALEPFAESVALHVPLLPVVGDEDPLEVVRAGDVPGARRAASAPRHRLALEPRRGGAPGDDPHLRSRCGRSRAGPSPIDMPANMAFLVGLTMALASEMDWMARSMPFEWRGATSTPPPARASRPCSCGRRRGALSAARARARARPAADPRARAGATGDGRRGPPRGRGPARDRGHTRVDRGTTGAYWQRRALAALERELSRDEALARMTEEYLARCREGAPVAEWSLPA